MARTRGGGIIAQGRPRGRDKGRGAQVGRMDIVEKGEAANQSGNAPRNETPSEAFVRNKRSDGCTCGTESE